MPLDPRIPLMADQIVLPDRLAAQQRRQQVQANRMAMEAQQATAQRNAMLRSKASLVDFTSPQQTASFASFGEGTEPYVENATRVQSMATAQSAQARAAAEEERKHRDEGFKLIGQGLLGALADPSDMGLTTIRSSLEAQGIPADQLEPIIGPIMRLPPGQRTGAIRQFVATNETARQALEFVSPKPVEVNLGDRVAFIDANPNSPTYNQEVRSDAVGVNPNQPVQIVQGAAGAYALPRGGEGEAVPVTSGGAPIGLPPAAGGQAGGRDAFRARAAEAGLDNVAVTRGAIAAAINQATNLSSGFVGSMTERIPGSPAADLDARLNTIRANISFDRLQQMRQNSPTGGALGNVSNREMELLASTLGSLSLRQSPAQLVESLQTIDGIMQKLDAAYRADLERFGADAMGGAGGGQTQGAPRVGTVEGGYRFTGGDPSNPSSWERVR